MVRVQQEAIMRVAKLLRIELVLGAILAIGVALFALDLLSEDTASGGPSHLDRIDVYVRDQMEESRIPGVAVGVVGGGEFGTERVQFRGLGYDGRGNPITADTPFWIGSNTKSITALATMQLAEAGDIQLDAPVQRYLPEFSLADPKAASRITVRHLLNQTSGLSRHDSLLAVAEGDAQTLEEAVSDMRGLELNRPVGERFEYANLNSVVLGLIIERVTAETWQEYVRTRIFEPLRMPRTYTSVDEAKANGLTETHRYVFGFPVKSEAGFQPGLAPTGWVFSTANDMTRYLTMYLQGGILEGNRVLSESGIAEMLAPATNQRTFPLQSQEFKASYGAGWFVGPFGAAKDARWHQGSLPQFTAWMVLLPETSQAVVVLINAGNQFEIAGANAAWSRIPQGIVNVLRGELPPTGVGVTRFFIVFNTLVAAGLAVQVWSLQRVARRPGQPLAWRGKGARFLAPLLWEVGLGATLLLAFPALAGGLGWRATFSFVPDLSLVVVVVASLWLLTGCARIFRLLQATTTAPSGAHETYAGAGAETGAVA
jgi:CubicO group peptidase (beta-lactamase class C family)